MGGRQGGQWLEGRSRILAKQASHIVEIEQAVQCWYISYTSKKCLDKTNKKSQSGCCLECIQKEEGSQSGGCCNSPASRRWSGPD